MVGCSFEGRATLSDHQLKLCRLLCSRGWFHLALLFSLLVVSVLTLQTGSNLAMWPWVGDLTSLGFRFCSVKVRVLIWAPAL